MTPEQRSSINRARKIHGLGFWYRIRKETRVELCLLKDNERVCSGGKGKKYHILMREK